MKPSEVTGVDAAMMTSIVWVVEKGAYSDYRVVGVFSTEANAQAVAGKLGGSVSEWPLNPGIEKLYQGLTPWWVYITRKGRVLGCEIHSDLHPPRQPDSYVNGAGHLYINMWATDRNHAIKIANEKRLQILALNQWPEIGVAANFSADSIAISHPDHGSAQGESP